MKKGISSKKRALLGVLHRKAGGPFDSQAASELLEVDRAEARRLLNYLARRGWLVRLRHGWYSTVPLNAENPSRWREEPWAIANEIFSPCYLGGWTACEHWGLTDQIFRSTAVYTTRAIRERSLEINGQKFVVTRRSKEMLFGTRAVWSGSRKAYVSDATRTILDILDSPKMGGGIRHVFDVVSEYFDSEHKNSELLTDYLHRLGNGTAYKRLGFILETLGLQEPSLIETCFLKMTKGVSLLDPSGPSEGKITSRWALKVNSTIKRRELSRD